MNLIPTQYRVMAIAIIGAVALSGAAYGGFKLGHSVGHGAAASDCSDAKEKLNDKITALTTTLETTNEFNHQLQLSISESNNALVVAKAQADAAQAARLQAEELAARLQLQSKSRLEQLGAATQQATTCGPVLQKYWELRN